MKGDFLYPFEVWKREREKNAGAWFATLYAAYKKDGRYAGNAFSSFSNVKVMLRGTISGPVCLGVNHPSRAQDQICITVTQ
jgi:hypothetical protein